MLICLIKSLKLSNVQENCLIVGLGYLKFISINSIRMDPTTFEIDNDDNDVEFVKVETIKPKVNKVGIK